jgi:putative transposase
MQKDKQVNDNRKNALRSSVGHKAFKFRLYPNAGQRILLAKTFGSVRFVYNRMLADKIEHYNATGKMLRCWPSQYKEEFPWLKEVDSLALVGGYNALEAAYRNFFRDKSIGFPRFRSKHSGHNSYTTNLVNGNIVLEGGKLKLPKLGRVRIKQHRQIPAGYRLRSVTVSLTPSGRYYASILYEYDEAALAVTPVNYIGLDFSMSELYVDSNGNIPGYPRPYRIAQVKLAKEQRKLSRKKKGGKNREKQRQKVAKLHEHIANQRKDFLHKQSRQIANAYDAVCIEDLSMKGMARALHFGKSVSDNGWSMFTRMLEYKMADQGKYLVKISKWFPSSKMCSACGAVKEELPMSERTFRCDCGAVMDRDFNSAINILNEGKALLETNMLNRGTHGDSLVNILPIGRPSQEAPASIALRH